MIVNTLLEKQQSRTRLTNHIRCPLYWRDRTLHEEGGCDVWVLALQPCGRGKAGSSKTGFIVPSYVRPSPTSEQLPPQHWGPAGALWGWGAALLSPIAWIKDRTQPCRSPGLVGIRPQALDRWA